MKNISFKKWFSKLMLVMIRFPFSLLFIIGLAVLFFFSIDKIKIHENLRAFFVLGLTFNVAVTLFLEEFKKISSRILFNLGSIGLLAAYCFSLPEKFIEYQLFQVIALGITFTLSAFFSSFLKKDNEISFWNFSLDSIIQLCISAAFSVILFAGLSLAVLSLDKLFNIQINTKIYSDLAVACFVIFGPIYFLSNIPTETEKRKKDFSFNKVLKIFGIYILLPILSAYILILYVYLFQIIIKWQLPNGWVSTLVSVLGLGGFITMFILFPLRLVNENSRIKQLSIYFPLLLIPLLVLMSVGIFRRIDDYGLTINRLYMFLLNIWLYGISFFLLITRAKYLKWIVISFAAVLFLSSVGPWSVFNITKRSMVNETGDLLNKAKLLRNGKVIDRANTIQLDSASYEKLSQKIKYTCNTFGANSLQQYFQDTLKTNDRSKIEKIIGINDLTQLKINKSGKKIRWFNAEINEYNSALKINKFSTFIRIHKEGGNENIFKNKELTVNYKPTAILISISSKDSRNITIPLSNLIKQFLASKRPNEKYDQNLMTIENENYKLIITFLSGNYNLKNDSIFVNALDADLFLK